MFRKQFLKSFTFLLFISFILSQSLFSQDRAVYLLQGKVTDSNTGQPVATVINFITASGKKIQTRSNSNDGQYQQVLTPGETYTVIFKNYLPALETPIFTLPSISKYTEMNKDFSVKKIREGLELLRLSAFAPNQSMLKTSEVAPLNAVKEFLNNNKNANLTITISTSDSYMPPTKKKVAVQGKKKTTYKNVTVTTEEQLQGLMSERVNSLVDYMKNTLNIPEKTFVIKQDLSTGKPAAAAKPEKKKKGKKTEAPANLASSHSNNVIISVGRLLNLE